MKKLFGILAAAAFAATLGVACGGGAATPAGDNTMPVTNEGGTMESTDPCNTTEPTDGTMMKSHDGMHGDPCGMGGMGYGGGMYGGAMYGGNAYGNGGGW